MQIIESGFRNDGYYYSRHNNRLKSRGSGRQPETSDSEDPEKWRIVIEPGARPRLEPHRTSIKNMKGRIMIYESYEEAKEAFEEL